MAKKKTADKEPKVKEDVVSSESGSLTLIDETVFEEGKTYKGSLSVLPGKRMFFKGYKKRDEDDDETTRKVDEGSMSCGSWAVYSSKNKIKVALTIENKVNMRIGKMGRFSYPFHSHEKRQQVVSTYHGSFLLA